MRRRGWIVLPIALVALPLSGVSEARRAIGCDRLRGADLAPGRTIKLVIRANEYNGTDLLGCALPRGRVRVFASSGAQGTIRRGYDVVQVAGAFMLLRADGVTPSANADTVTVRDIRSGDSYEIAYRCAQLGGNDCGRVGRSSSALRAVINERGQAVAALRVAGSGATTISGFSRLGERRDLDSGLPTDIPSGSLKIVGDRASWTNAGRMYAARLPE
ncbi:MAG TPA: hypothetical protein VF526_00235 [Solirubrobacteraceae bacterium]|jgi:hypothetical protein